MKSRRDIREILGAHPIRITRLAEEYVSGFPVIKEAVETQGRLVKSLEWLGWGLGGIMVLRHLVKGLK